MFTGGASMSPASTTVRRSNGATWRARLYVRMSDDWWRISRGPSASRCGRTCRSRTAPPTMATSTPARSTRCGSRMNVAGWAKRGETKDERGLTWWLGIEN